MKNFLVTTPIKESYSPLNKNIFLGSWCFAEEVDDKKKYKTINYHWSDKKKFKKDSIYIDKITDKLCNLLSENLNKIHNLNESSKYWNLLIYPWAHNYVSTMYERWESIQKLLKSNKETIFNSYELKINEKTLISLNHLSFIKNTYKDTWNHVVYLRIIKYLNTKKINLIKKNYKNFKKNKEVLFSLEKKNISYYLISLYELITAKFAFRFNNVIFDSFSFPAKEYLKISLKNLCIPSLYKNLFEDIGLKEDINLNKRKIEFKRFKKKNFKDKFFNFLIDNLIYHLPISYFENFLKIKTKMSHLANKKKFIISMRNRVYNDQFKICIAELIKRDSKYFTCAHGGGLVGHFMELKNYIGKITNHISYDIDSLSKNKLVRLSPTINVIDKKEFNTKNNERLGITFLEGLKYSHKIASTAKAEEGIKQISELLRFVDCLPPNIKKNVLLRSKRPYTLNIKNRFVRKFGQHRFNENRKQDFSDFAKSIKLMIINYPQTAYSSSMYYNVPTILVCDKQLWFFKKKSLKMFNILKKNKMAFENFEEAEKYIVKNWDEIYSWWNSAQVQKIRKLYLKDFFNIKKNWFAEWSNFVSNQKKLVFK